MKATEFISEEYEQFYTETAKMVWGRTTGTAKGGKTKLRFRCSTGPRAGRQVSHPSKCHQQYNVAKAQKMKTTRARTGPTAVRRQQRTKSINTASVLARKLNTGKPGQPRPYI
jgi:hypothetical protein